MGLLPVLLLVVGDVVLHVLVLLKEQPKHAVQLLSRLDLHLLMRLHICQFLLQVLDARDLMIGKLTLISHQVLVGTHKVLL